VGCILCVCVSVSKCKGGRLRSVCARERASEGERGGGRGRGGERGCARPGHKSNEGDVSWCAVRAFCRSSDTRGECACLTTLGATAQGLFKGGEGHEGAR
jgi:hypothetical protein